MKTAAKTFLAALLLVTALGTPLRAAENDPANDAQPVRIDNTGIHVGGSDPVDINMPNWGNRVGPLIPIVAIVFTFGSPVAVLGLFFYFRYRRNRMMHETLRAMVEKGVPIPPELLAGDGAGLAHSLKAAP